MTHKQLQMLIGLALNSIFMVPYIWIMGAGGRRESRRIGTTLPPCTHALPAAKLPRPRPDEAAQVSEVPRRDGCGHPVARTPPGGDPVLRGEGAGAPLEDPLPPAVLRPLGPSSVVLVSPSSPSPVPLSLPREAQRPLGHAGARSSFRTWYSLMSAKDVNDRIVDAEDLAPATEALVRPDPHRLRCQESPDAAVVSDMCRMRVSGVN